MSEWEREEVMGEDLIRNVYERLGSIEAKLDGIGEVRSMATKAEEKAELAHSTAEESLASTKSAHKRLDKMDKIIWWASTTIIGAVILALLAMVLKTN